MLRRLHLAVLAFLALAAPAVALDFGLPELGIQPSGTCRTLAVRDRSSNAMVPLGCLDTAGKSFVPAGNASGMTVAPNPTAAAGTLARALATPTFNLATVLQGLTVAPATSAGGLVYQSNGITAANILGPQQPPSYFTHDGIRSTMVVLPGATAQTTSGFGFYVRNTSTRDATGIFGTCVASVDGAPCWGGNLTMIDADANGVVTSGANRRLIGIEINPSVTSAGTTVQGISIIGSSIAQPAYADGITVSHLNASAPGTRSWDHAFVIGDASAKIGYLTGALALTGSTVGGIPNYLNYRDGNGAAQAVTYQASGLGALNVFRTDAANGISLLPAVAGQFPTVQAYGTDANTGLVLKGQGLGQVIAQTLLNAAKGLYVSVSAVFTVPVKFPVYTVAALPTCNAAAAGSLATVSDATNPTYNGALTGGGTVPIPVFCRGDVWLAH